MRRFGLQCGTLHYRCLVHGLESCPQDPEVGPEDPRDELRVSFAIHPLLDTPTLSDQKTVRPEGRSEYARKFCKKRILMRCGAAVQTTWYQRIWTNSKNFHIPSNNKAKSLLLVGFLTVELKPWLRGNTVFLAIIISFE